MDHAKKVEKATESVRSKFNYPVAFYDNDLSAVIQVPGWSYGDYGCNGKLSLWRLAKVDELGRVLFSQDTQYSRNYHSSDTMVVGAKTIDLSRRIQNEAGMICPMVLISKVESIGASSFTWQTELRERHSGELLAFIARQMFYINPQTRRRTTIPTRLATNRDRYPPTESFVIPIPDIPKQAFRIDMQVTASDMDHFYHTNQASYFRFSMDALFEAWRARALTFDPDLHDVRRTESRYLRESFAGDDLTVNVWCDNEDAYIVHVIVRKGDNRIFYTSIQFYPPESHVAHL